MPTSNFYLRNPNSKSETFIILKFRYHKRSFSFSTRQKVLPAYWNYKKQKAKELDTFPQHTDLNNRLDKIKNETINQYRKSILKGELPTRKDLSDHLLEVMLLKFKNEDIEDLTFYEYLDLFIEESEQGKRLQKDGTIIRKNTFKSYYTLRDHLHALKRKYGYTVQLKSVNNKSSSDLKKIKDERM